MFDEHFPGIHDPYMAIFWKVHQFKVSSESALGGNMRAKELYLIGWQFPPPGFHMLNSNGSLRRQTGKAATGGVVKDDNGNWVCRVAINLGLCSVVMAEA